jgi:type I restriction enzyme S subunit
MNYIGNDDVVFVRPPQNAEARRTQVESGDVLLTITGSRIGRVAPVPNELAGSYVSQHVAILRPKSSILPRFLSFYLSLHGGGQRQVSKAQYGQTKPGLNFEQIKRFNIPIPPLRLQAQFVTRAEDIEGLITLQQAHLAKLDALVGSLQHGAFRGELSSASAARVDAELAMAG